MGWEIQIGRLFNFNLFHHVISWFMRLVSSKNGNFSRTGYNTRNKTRRNATAKNSLVLRGFYRIEFLQPGGWIKIFVN